MLQVAMPPRADPPYLQRAPSPAPSMDVLGLVERMLDDKFQAAPDRAIKANQPLARDNRAPFSAGPSSATTRRRSQPREPLERTPPLESPPPDHAQPTTSELAASASQPDSDFAPPGSLPHTLPSYPRPAANDLQRPHASAPPPVRQSIPSDVQEFRQALKLSPEVARPFQIHPEEGRRSISPASAVSSEGHASDRLRSHTRSRSASQSTFASVSHRHSRRGSIASFMGFGAEGLAPMSAIPPALSEARVSIMHQGQDQRTLDSSLMDEDLPLDLKQQPMIPMNRSSYLDAPTPGSSAMAQCRSDPGQPSHRRPSHLYLPPSDVPFLFPSQPSSPVDSISHSRHSTSHYSHQEHNGQEEPDSNPLYVLLSTSSEPEIKDAWRRAGLLLLPPRQQLPDVEDMLKEQNWVRKHAFEEVKKDSGVWSCLGGDWNASIRDDTVTLRNRAPSLSTRASHLVMGPARAIKQRISTTSLTSPPPDIIPFPTSNQDSEDEDEILVPYRPRPVPADNVRTLRIKSEVPLYRKAPRQLSHSTSNASLHASQSQQQQHPTLRQKISSGKLRPRWLQRASLSRPGPPPIPEKPVVHQELLLERVRVVSVDGEVWPWTGQARTPAQAAELEVKICREREVPSLRNIYADLSFFVDPEYDDEHLPAVRDAICQMAQLCHQFASQFVYVKGFEKYTAQRIRRGILDKIWADMTEFFEPSSKLYQMVENIVMGFIFHKVYVQSIVPSYLFENRRLNDITASYRQHCDLGDFFAGPFVDCSAAISILRQLVLPFANSDLLSPASLVQLRSLTAGVPDSDLFIDSLLDAKTPFDIITVIRLTIDELVKSVDGAAGSRMTSTDDLLPLLAYTIVKSGLQDLESLLFYIKNFTQSSLGPEYDWSIVNFQAAISYLQSDPLQPAMSALSTSPVSVNVHRPSPIARRHTDDQSRSPTEKRPHRRSNASPLLRAHSTAKLSTDSYLSLKSAASKSTTSLVDLDERRSSLHSRRIDQSKHVPPYLTDLLASPPERRHDASDASSVGSHSHTDLCEDGRTCTNRLSMALSEPHFSTRSRQRSSVDSSLLLESGSVHSSGGSDCFDSGNDLPVGAPIFIKPAFDGQSAKSGRLAGADMGRTGSASSEGHAAPAKRNSVDWSSFFRSPVLSDATSPRSGSPADNTTEDGILEGLATWTRRRLSSVTSLGSFSSYDAAGSMAGHERKASETSVVADKPKPRNPNLPFTRTYSLDDADLGGQRESPTQAFPRGSARPRPLSTISVTSSISDADTGAGGTVSPVSRHGSVNSTTRRRRRSGRLRRDLLSSSTSALPHVDLTSAGISFRPTHSPIRETFSTS